MPFIYNNLDYQFVESTAEWNQLEYVVVRMLRVDIAEKEVVDIQKIRNKMETYGPLERVEIFRNEKGQKFAHVTFKLNSSAYFAMKEINSAENKTFIVKIHPANARFQPDNPIDPDTSPLKNLSDFCLEKIFRFCDIHEQARLGMVCKRFRDVLIDRVWLNRKAFKLNFNADLKYRIQAAVNLIQCNKPRTFKISLFNAMDNVDYENESLIIEFDTPKTSILVELCLFENIQYFHELSDQIQTLSIKLTTYNHCYFGDEFSQIFGNVEELRIIGFSSYMRLPNIASRRDNFPNIKKIYYESGHFYNPNFIKYMKTWTSLNHFYFKDCTFTQYLPGPQLKIIYDYCEEAKRLVWIHVDLIREPIPSKYCACCGFSSISHPFQMCGKYCIHCGSENCEHECEEDLPQCHAELPRYFDFVRFISGPLPTEIAEEKMN